MQTASSRWGSAGTVFSNARALLIIQVANQLLPLVLIPFLARTLGAPVYGVVSFGFAIVAMASIVTDYGFNLSITLRISKRRDNVAYVNRLIGAVFFCKCLLLLLVLPAILVYAAFTREYADYSAFFALLWLPIIAQTFLPVWFFQGIEKMGYIAVFTLASRLAYVALAFFLIRAPDHMVRLALINGVSQLVALILSLWFVVREGYRPAWPGVRHAFLVGGASTSFFWSRAAVSIYTAGGSIFLGLFAGPSQVAFYAAAEQLYRGAQALFAPLSQALYPNMARTRNFSLLFKVIKGAVGICIAGGLFGAIAGEWIIRLLFGSSFAESYPVLLVFLLTLLVNTPSVLLGYPLLGALGKTMVANQSVLIAGIIQIGLLSLCVLFGWSRAWDVAMTVLIVETIVLCLRAFWARKYYTEWRSRVQASEKLA